MTRVRPSSLRRAFLWLPPLVYAALIFHFSSETDPMPGLTRAVWDKALHSVEYAGLALLLCRACRGEGGGWLASCAFAFIVACAYALSDEWHQAFVPGRDSNPRDWLADATGGWIGVVFYWFAASRRWLRTLGREPTRYEHG